MIKIKLYELDNHRNECAFRPYLWAQNVLRDIGIEFTTGNSYDYAWIAQASIINKKVSLQESVDTGLEFLSKVTGDYMILDGQDSTSLMGTYEVFKQSNALLLLKNSLLKDKSLYKQGLQLGRAYWGPGDYKLEDFDQYSDRIVLSGTNWLMTHWAGIKPQWYNYSQTKQFDISAMFQYPQGVDVYEHGHLQSIHYDNHRKPMMEVLSKMDYNIAKLTNGIRVSQQEYYQRISNAKILLAPYGYGEMAPRDLDAAQFGAVLIKPDMSFVDTIPNVFNNNETYIACKHDYSDLQEKIDMVLGNYKNYQYIIENARKKFEEVMRPEPLAMHLYNMFKNINGVTV
tara:strand:+ start:385 stop:1410 length:1026 start_codon:yes stop_codon:yes gene_type:complete